MPEEFENGDFTLKTQLFSVHTTPEDFENGVLTLKAHPMISIHTSPGESTVRKKMATGKFTYNALRTKTLKERIKSERKIVSHSNMTRAML